MLVRQLVGPEAGRVVDMPYHVARAKVLDGSGVWPDDDGKTEKAKPSVPQDWEAMKFFAKRALAKQLTGATAATSDEANELIKAYLAPKA